MPAIMPFTGISRNYSVEVKAEATKEYYKAEWETLVGDLMAAGFEWRRGLTYLAEWK